MLQRNLIEKIENRILVGIVAFVGIMLLVGWTAINENARMASFDQQYLARSIERGAELFAANCASCHNADGRGQIARAPALNSPHFFGYDFFAEANAQRLALETEQAALIAERDTLAAELGTEISEARRGEITAQLDEIAARLAPEGIPAELAAVDEEIAALQVALAPAVQVGYPLDQPSRLAQASWASTLDAFIYTTLEHGRSIKAYAWGGNIMAAWGNEAGGTMRPDQLQDLTNYILNWDKGDDWTIEDALLVNQYYVVGDEFGGGELAQAVGYDTEAILAAWSEEGIVGDPERGRNLYNGDELSQRNQVLPCAGCHGNDDPSSVAGNGPAYIGTYERVVNERLVDPEYVAQFGEQTPDYYLTQSIILPNDYIVPNYNGGVMNQNFGEVLSAQDLADLVEYLKASGPNYVAPENPTSGIPEEGEGEEAPTDDAAEGAAQAAEQG